MRRLQASEQGPVEHSTPASNRPRGFGEARPRPWSRQLGRIGPPPSAGRRRSAAKGHQLWPSAIRLGSSCAVLAGPPRHASRVPRRRETRTSHVVNRAARGPRAASVRRPRGAAIGSHRDPANRDFINRSSHYRGEPLVVLSTNRAWRTDHGGRTVETNEERQRDPRFA